MIDLDQNHNPVWLWNEFDHLDMNRQPIIFRTGRTECRSLFGGRRKSDYLDPAPELAGEDGLCERSGCGRHPLEAGLSGRFHVGGRNGSRRLVLRAAWPSFTTTNTTGTFSMTLFDNGRRPGVSVRRDLRTSGQPPCFTARYRFFNIDETAKTATLTFHPTAPRYSFFGGNARS